MQRSDHDRVFIPNEIISEVKQLSKTSSGILLKKG